MLTLAPSSRISNSTTLHWIAQVVVNSKDGKLLVFLSSRCAVDSGAHNATDSLHKINWPFDWKTDEHLDVVWPYNLLTLSDWLVWCFGTFCAQMHIWSFNLCQVPVVMCPEDGCFPGLYCSSMLSDPWLSNHCTLILTSAWRSTQVILSVDVLR